MTRTEFTDRINYCRRELQFLEQVSTNCTRCISYQVEGVCLKYGKIPPDFIQQGCDDWYFDDVPF